MLVSSSPVRPSAAQPRVPLPHIKSEETDGRLQALEAAIRDTLASARAGDYGLGMNRISVVERAFELAQSGQCHGVDDIRRRLKEEQFSAIDEHLAGPSLKRQLADICTKACRPDG